MNTETFASPDPIEIIPADRIRPLIAATERELAVLDRTATEAIAAADDAEEWERASTNDGASSAWSLIRLHREQRDEAQRDAEVMIELANRHAQSVIEEARAEAEETLARATRTEPEAPRNGRVHTDPAAAHPSPAPVATAPVTTTVAVDTPTPPAPPAVEPPAAEPPRARRGLGRRSSAGPVTAVLDAPTVAEAPAAVEAVVLDAPTAAIPTAAEPLRVVPAPIPVVPEPVVPEPVVAEPVAETTVAEPVVAAPVVAQPVAGPPVAAPAVVTVVPDVATTQFTPPTESAHLTAPAGDGFWPAEGKSRRRMALPLSAVLEASAVLLILVFILLRLS